jgi:hypothetical protein
MALTNVYDVLENLRDELLKHPLCNTVTTGDIYEVDLSKQTIFPLSHITITSSSLKDHTIQFSVSVMAMDIVDISKKETTDIFYGNNNEIDILNSQLAVLNHLGEELRRGTLLRDLFVLDGDISCTPFYEKSENMLAGWVGSFTIVTKNNINIC